MVILTIYLNLKKHGCKKKKSQARYAYRRTKKIIGNTYTKAKEATKRRFAANKVKINEFIEKIKELIKNFRKKEELDQQSKQHLIEELNTLANNQKQNAENNIKNSEIKTKNSTTRNTPLKTKSKSKTKSQTLPQEPSFYNNQIKTDASKIREITERIDYYIQYGNNKYVTLKEIENYYTMLDGNIHKVNTNAKQVIDYINDKLNEIDTYFKSINLDEAISVSNLITERSDLKENLDTIKDHKNHKKNIKEILQRITKYSMNRTMYKEIDAILETHYKTNNNNN